MNKLDVTVKLEVFPVCQWELLLHLHSLSSSSSSSLVFNTRLHHDPVFVLFLCMCSCFHNVGGTKPTLLLTEKVETLPCPRTAGLTPCTPPVQRTGSTPSPFWPAETQLPHSSLGPPSSWRAPSLSCSAPVAVRVDVKRRPSLRWWESTGTAAGSSLLALAISEIQVPKLKSSDESWATLKQLVKVVMGNGWGRGSVPSVANPKAVSLGLSGSRSAI